MSIHTSAADVQTKVNVTSSVEIELGEIQGGILHPRPSPYAGAYLLMLLVKVGRREAGLPWI